MASSAPEVSYGTHFFQDLVETEIYPLALYPDQGRNDIQLAILPRVSQRPGRPTARLRAVRRIRPRLIDVPAVAQGRLLEVIMDGESSQALGYLRYYPTERWLVAVRNQGWLAACSQPSVAEPLRRGSAG